MDILIVEDNPEMLEHLEKSLLNIDNINTILTAKNKSEGITLLEGRNPDLLICDLCLPDGSGLDIIARSTTMSIPSLVVSVLCDATTVVQAVESGASGYLLKDLDPEKIQAAVTEVISGGAPITPSIATHILQRVRDENNISTTPSNKDNHYNLSKRELEVLQLVARGFKITEIATHLEISEHTVSNHNRSVYKKLRVNSRSQAIYKAFKCGLISD